MADGRIIAVMDAPRGVADVLASASTPRFRAHPVTVAVATATLAATAFAAWAASPPHGATHRTSGASAVSTSSPSPTATTPAPADVTPPPDLGSVFCHPLGQCTRADPGGRLRVAVRMTNLGNRPLHGVSASLVDPGTVRLTQLRVGTGTCGDAATPPRWLPSRDVVAALGFVVPPACSGGRQLAVWVSVEEDHRVLRAESPPLADLHRLGICTSS